MGTDGTEQHAGPVPATDAELDAIVAFVAEQQARPERNIVYLGVEPDGIRAELDALSPPWSSTVRVVHGPAGDLVGVALGEWDDEVARAWILGPWVRGGQAEWDRWARPLVNAVLEQVPPAIVDREMSGDVANERLRSLAAELGWPPTETNYAYVLDADTVAGWEPDADADLLRPVAATDLDVIEPLHDAEFPASYAPASLVVQRAVSGEHEVIGAIDGSGILVGYASGHVQPDGEGYIDFVAVAPGARGTGAGRRLVRALARRLLDASTTGRVNLTVQEHRAPARQLYEALGFRVDIGFRGYRDRPST